MTTIRRAVVVALLLSAGLLLAAAPAAPGRAPVPTAKAVNIGFESGSPGQKPPGWELAKAYRDDGWKAEIFDLDVMEGFQSVRIRNTAGKTSKGMALLSQLIDAKPYRGRKVVLTGYVKTDGREGGGATLWLRVDRPSGMGFFDNGMNRPVTTAEWTPFLVEGPVDADAVSIAFGCLVNRTEALFDALRIYAAD